MLGKAHIETNETQNTQVIETIIFGAEVEMLYEAA